MIPYKKLIFDLDDTLIDNRENIKYAFKKILEYKEEEFTEEKFFLFYEIDKKFWEDWTAGKIFLPEEYSQPLEKKIAWVRAQRFLIYFHYKISLEEAMEMSDNYIGNLREKVLPIQGAEVTLKQLSEQYEIIVATNGPLKPMKEKFKKANLLDYIDITFSAEEVGKMKPDPIFFNGIMEKVGCKDKKEYLIIGDSILSDIKGANQIGIDSCFFCRQKSEMIDKMKATYTIQKLEELLLILK